MRSQLSVLWSILFEHVNAGRAVAYRLNHALPDDLHTTKRTKTEVSNIPPLLLISFTQTHTPRLTLFLLTLPQTTDEYEGHPLPYGSLALGFRALLPSARVSGSR